MKKSGFNLSVAFVLAFLISSCDSFIPDPIDPRLPVYSESGKNQAGAMINNEPFNDFPKTGIYGKLYSGYIWTLADTSLNISFNLVKKNQANTSFTITFFLENLTPGDWKEMENDFGKKFRFENPNVKGAITTRSNNGDIENKATSGQITVKYIPGAKAFAGTFGFTAEDPSGKKYLVHFGRFDYVFEPN